MLQNYPLKKYPKKKKKRKTISIFPNLKLTYT